VKGQNNFHFISGSQDQATSILLPLRMTTVSQASGSRANGAAKPVIGIIGMGDVSSFPRCSRFLLIVRWGGCTHAACTLEERERTLNYQTTSGPADKQDLRL
jgi:hypothetical protein